MSTVVQICNVKVLENPSNFSSPFQMEITFECFASLPDDLEWKLTYVGSAESKEHDQVLDSVVVGPVPEGRHMFVFQADAPDPLKIPAAELMGVTVILLSCAYRDQEFVTIGFFVSNDYTDQELRDNPPEKPRIDLIQRHILADEPRVTVHPIRWGELPSKDTAGGDEPTTSQADDTTAATIDQTGGAHDVAASVDSSVPREAQQTTSLPPNSTSPTPTSTVADAPEH